MAYSDDLLEQAQHLAQREPKRPRQASLRRAVSSAYYALFHLLISETTKNWKRPAERHTLARMFDHGPMGKVCTTKRDELNAYFKTNPPASPNESVPNICRTSQTRLCRCYKNATPPKTAPEEERLDLARASGCRRRALPGRWECRRAQMLGKHAR